MKSIRIHAFGGPEVLRVEDVPDPKPEAGQVVVRAKAIGINPVDTYIRTGRYGDRKFPFVLGFDAAGIVEDVGPGVMACKPGDRVYTYQSVSGAYTERILCNESSVHPLPAALTFPQGAAIGVPYSTAYYALMQRGHAAKGETVFIHGASGGVGIAAIQIAKAKGLKVVGTASTPGGQELVLKEGADFVFNHLEAGYLDRLMAYTNAKGVPLILEMLANINLANDLKILSMHGRVVVIGSRGSILLDPRDAMVRTADIRGMTLMNLTDEEIKLVHTSLAEGLQKGLYRPVIGKEIPLAEVARAHEEVMKPGAYGKIVLIP